MYFNGLIEDWDAGNNCSVDGDSSIIRTTSPLQFEMMNRWGSQWTSIQFKDSKSPGFLAGNNYLFILEYKYLSPATALGFKFYNPDNWEHAANSVLWELEYTNGTWVKPENPLSYTSASFNSAAADWIEKRYLFECGVDDAEFRMSLGYGDCFDTQHDVAFPAPWPQYGTNNNDWHYYRGGSGCGYTDSCWQNDNAGMYEAMWNACAAASGPGSSNADQEGGGSSCNVYWTDGEDQYPDPECNIPECNWDGRNGCESTACGGGTVPDDCDGGYHSDDEGTGSGNWNQCLDPAAIENGGNGVGEGYEIDISCSGGAGCIGNAYSTDHGIQRAYVQELTFQLVDDEQFSRQDFGIKILNSGGGVQVDSSYQNYACAVRGMGHWSGGGADWDVQWNHSSNEQDTYLLGAPLPPDYVSSPSGLPVQAILLLKPRFDLLRGVPYHHDGSVDADGGADDPIFCGNAQLIYDNNNNLRGFTIYKHPFMFDIAHRWFINWKIMTPVDYIMANDLVDIQTEPYGLQVRKSNGLVNFDSRLEPMQLMSSFYHRGGQCPDTGYGSPAGFAVTYKNTNRIGSWDDDEPEESYNTHPFYVQDAMSYQDLISDDVGSGKMLFLSMVTTPECMWWAAPYYGFFHWECALHYINTNGLGYNTPYYDWEWDNNHWGSGPGIGNQPDTGCLNPDFIGAPFIYMNMYGNSNAWQHYNNLFLLHGVDWAYGYQPYATYLGKAHKYDGQVVDETLDIYEELCTRSSGSGIPFHQYYECSNTETSGYAKFQSIGGAYGNHNDTYSDSGVAPGINLGGQEGSWGGTAINYGIVAKGHISYAAYPSFCASEFPTNRRHYYDGSNNDYSTSNLVTGGIFKWNVWIKQASFNNIMLIDVDPSTNGPWNFRIVKQSGNSLGWKGYGQLLP